MVKEDRSSKDKSQREEAEERGKDDCILVQNSVKWRGRVFGDLMWGPGIKAGPKTLGYDGTEVHCK